jgi:hypothetical protein
VIRFNEITQFFGDQCGMGWENFADALLPPTPQVNDKNAPIREAAFASDKKALFKSVNEQGDIAAVF